MNLFKIERAGEKIFIRMLVHNERVWCERQWYYNYVREGNYPTNDPSYATDFKTVEKADEWIKEHLP